MIRNIAVIGAGASGMMASIVASKRGHKVTLFEKSKKVGTKILATGNGRCNITNQNITVQNYHSAHLSFARDILKRFGSEEAKKFFKELGLELVELGEKGRLYPMSLQACSVVDYLEYEVRKLGVEIVLNCEIKKVEKISNKFRILESNFDTILISSGSLAHPSLGSSDSGYQLAKSFGHESIKEFASLVQLVCDDNTFKEASGVKIDAGMELFVDKEPKVSKRGDLLFTNYGLSGSSILDISRFASLASLKKQDVAIVIDLLPDMSLDELKSLLSKRINIQKPIELWLNGLIHKKLIKLILKESNLKVPSQINRKYINKLAYAIKNLKIAVSGTKGVKNAEVMAGGIKTEDINSKTLESKLLEGLFFSGEVLDVDGDCGGFNLHFAWASGYIAGLNL